jgi:hypothetical protein
VLRETLYPQQYRTGVEYRKPILSRTVVPDVLREQRARLAQWQGARGASRWADAGPSKEEQAAAADVQRQVGELQQLHAACEQECARARSISARGHVIAALREESVALAQRATQDAQLRALRGEWRQAQRGRADERAADARDDELTRVLLEGESVPAALQREAERALAGDAGGEGVPWSLKEGIPPVLSKVRPGDAVAVLQELLAQLSAGAE